MLITKNMLVVKGFDQASIAYFERVYPNGFDFSDSKQPLLPNLEGVARIFSFTGLYTNEEPKEIYQVNFINGYANDFPNGNPGRVVIDTVSKLPLIVTFVRDGKAQNPKKHYPAIISYYPNGSIFQRIFIDWGIINDPQSNIPAWITFYPNGIIEREDYYRNGELNDPADGTPARTYYDVHGNVNTQLHYKDGIAI